MWDPKQYHWYQDERARPFFELLDRVEHHVNQLPVRIADLGCGTGELTANLLNRWPEAVIYGIDSSAEMLAKARGLVVPGKLEFVQADLRVWKPPAKLDVLVSNATLQWLPDHDQLIPHLAGMLRSGGILAFQVPGYFEGRRLFKELRDSPRWKDRVGSQTGSLTILPDVAFYVQILAKLGFKVDAWQTTYYHILQGENAVLEWVKGTMLRPVLSNLNEEEGNEFLQELNTELLKLYPLQEFGTVLPFQRLFVIAVK
jgi:trans-aconitate 2-methyltransferase